MHKGIWPVDHSPSLFERLIWKLNCRTLVKRSLHVICVSRAVREQISKKVFGQDCEHISVQIPQYPDHLVGEYRIGTGGTRLIFLGRVEESKGVFDLSQAFERISAAHPYATLKFVGGGSDLVRLRRAVESSSVTNRVSVDGPCNGSSFCVN